MLRLQLDSFYAVATHLLTDSTMCHCFSQAWDVILKETENLSRSLRSNSEHLSNSTAEVLFHLIEEKKAARRKYMEERERLDSDFARVGKLADVARGVTVKLSFSFFSRSLSLFLLP